MGQPKQLIRFAGETLLERTVRIASEAGCDPVIVVLGASPSEILAQSNLRQAVPVINSAWQQGMASSLRRGLEAIPDSARGVLLLTCDQPAISAGHLRSLLATGVLTASSYAHRRGVPAYFPASMFADLNKLRGDTGARALLHTAPTIDLPHGERDIDTPEDLQNFEALFG